MDRSHFYRVLTPFGRLRVRIWAEGLPRDDPLVLFTLVEEVWWRIEERISERGAWT